MTLAELLNQITDLGNRIRTQATQLAAQANDPHVSIADLEARQAELAEMNTRMATLQAAYNAMQGQAQANLEPVKDSPAAAHTFASVQDMLRSNEYARAFAYAVQNGINRKNGRGNANVSILFDALTEGGGTPVGSDGGFLVPEDLDRTIRELRRTMDPLADLFNAESVTAPTGWRVMDSAPATAMPLVNEMDNVLQDDQPKFVKVPYAIAKYGLILPASNELLTDNISNLFGYIGKWFARKQVLTENTLLLGSMKKLSASALGSDPIGGLKKVLNVTLDPSLSASATIVCNQDGFDFLDQLVDKNGRGLLQPDPTNATQYKILGRTVKTLANRTMPTNENLADVFVGDFREYATLFTGHGFEVATTDVGGNAWATDSTEIRGIVRMGVSEFDTAAVARRNVTLA